MRITGEKQVSGNLADKASHSFLQGSFTCRKSTTWDRRLYFPSEGSARYGFLSPIKIHRPRPDRKPQQTVPWVLWQARKPLNQRGRRDGLIQWLNRWGRWNNSLPGSCLRHSFGMPPLPEAFLNFKVITKFYHNISLLQKSAHIYGLEHSLNSRL
jgi:hypothetical protein